MCSAGTSTNVVSASSAGLVQWIVRNTVSELTAPPPLSTARAAESQGEWRQPTSTIETWTDCPRYVRVWLSTTARRLISSGNGSYFSLYVFLYIFFIYFDSSVTVRTKCVSLFNIHSAAISWLRFLFSKNYIYTNT